MNNKPNYKAALDAALEREEKLKQKIEDKDSYIKRLKRWLSVSEKRFDKLLEVTEKALQEK